MPAGGNLRSVFSSLLGSGAAVAAVFSLSITHTAHAAAATTQASSTTTLKDRVSQYLGLNYFTFFDGPGVGTDFTYTPNNLGRASDRGWSFWTNLSARGKFSSNLALDVQFRLQQIVTNELEARYQGARVGLSGTLLKVESPAYTLIWSGAMNTDLPGVGGQIVSERALIANPGLFSNLTLRPRNSKFSVFALVSPRIWFYSDPQAMDRQALEGGAVLGQKPEVAINLQPSINYDLTEKTVVRAGMLFDIRKNMNDDSLRRWFWPVDFGVSHQINNFISIYPHARFSGPWDNGLRAELNAPTGTRWTDTASLGLWINGTLL
jgi:hypothetical protein